MWVAVEKRRFEKPSIERLCGRWPEIEEYGSVVLLLITTTLGGDRSGLL